MIEGALLHHLKDYLSQVFDTSIASQVLRDLGKFPVFLTQMYSFYQSSIDGRPCVLVLPKDEQELAPSVLENHLKNIETRTANPCLFVFKDISPYVRKKLISHRMPFVVPGSQVYLPDFGFDLRERFRSADHVKKNKLSPAAQAVVIYALLHPKLDRITLSALAKKLSYTPMTMTRVLNELGSANICDVAREENKRFVMFERNHSALWEKARELMRSPVKKRVWVRAKDKKKLVELGVVSGLDALARQSMLNHSDCPTLAISKQSFKTISSLEQIPFADEADFEIELWAYDPKLFATNGLVDPFSLFLSLRHEHDERVQIELEALMRKIKW